MNGKRTQRLRSARRERNRRRRKRLLLGAVAAVLFGAASSAIPYALLYERGDESDLPFPDAIALPAEEPDTEQRRLLLVTASGDGTPASSVTLLATPSADGPAAAVFLPTTTLVHVPGFGSDQLAAAHRYGGGDLLRAAVENALSVPIHAVAVATEGAFAEFLGRAGQLDVTVTERLVDRYDDGSASLAFEQGSQTLDGDGLARLWLHGSGDDEIASFERRQTVLSGLLAAASDEVVRNRLVADGAPQLRTDAEAEWVRGLFEDLTIAHAEDQLRFRLLPVERFGAAGVDGRRAYRIQQDETAQLVATVLGGPRHLPGAAPARAQVLNGVGVPGVGQMIDELVSSEVRLVLTGNANHFEHAETKLLIYEETESALDLAERVRAALGVGTIQVSRQPQSMVDITIVVGADLVDVPEPSQSEDVAALADSSAAADDLSR